MTVSAALGRNIDTCNGTTTVRTIPFKLLDASHVKIYPYTISTNTLGAALTLNSDYTIQNIGSDNAQYTTIGGSSPWTSLNKLIVVRSVPFSQSAAYVQNDSFPAATHEAALDKLTMICQQMQDTMSRAAVLPQFSDPALAVVLPTPVDGYGLVWSSTGGTMVNTSVSLATLQTQAAALYAIASNITTVAGISANVTSVAGDLTNINNVAADLTNINAVAADLTAINSVAADLTNIDSVVSNATHINTVAGISANVTTVAGISANVTTVAGISTDVTSVKNIAANVTTVAGIAAAVSTVSGINAAVSTVSGISANVTTVAGISANVTTVAGISANVTTVAGISANVTSVAGDLTNINNVAADLTNINNVAADLTNINNVAADLTNINNVAADLTNIDTCASNIAAINAAPAQAAAAAASAASAAASASGISMRGSCRVAATGALTVTYSNGVLGVGATLTNAGAKAAFAQDGITVSVGERVLVPSQASALQNGMYTLTVAGDGSTNWVLTRATDYDEASEVVEGTATIIEEGTVNASHIYVMTHHGAITMGTTAIDFTALTANATSANTLTTPRAIYGNNFDGSAALTQIIASTYGGSGNGFTKFSGPTTSEKTFTLPDASATILTTNVAVTPGQGGTGLTTYAAGDILYCSATNVLSKLAKGSDTNVLTLASGLPSWAAPAGSSQVVLLATATASTSSTLDFTSKISSSYSSYYLVFEALYASGSATSANLYVSGDNGSTWTPVLEGQIAAYPMGSTTSPAFTVAASGASPAAITIATGFSSSRPLTGWATFKVGAGTSDSQFLWENTLNNTGGTVYKTLINAGDNTTVNAIRLAPGAGTFASGTVYLYGIKNT